MTACPNRAENLEQCSCSYPCDKRGVCCKCVAYHRSKGQIPGCFFSKQGEASYDRSASAFARDCGV